MSQIINHRTVRTREDFIAFGESLLADLRSDPERWENNGLERYLDALVSIVSSLDGRYANRNQPLPEQPTWGMMAEILAVASAYE
jgi:hypothetical protein